MKILPLLFIAVFLMSSQCGKETTIAVDKGNIAGSARRYNELGQVRPENDNITVSLRNDAGSQATTTTDKGGRFYFKDIEPGIYDIICSYPGDDTATIYSFQFSGNGTAWVGGSDESLRVIKPAFTKFQNVDVRIENGSLKVRGKKIDWVSETGEFFYYRIFFSQGADVSKQEGKYLLTYSAGYDASVDSVLTSIPLAALYPDLKKGRTYYAVVYPGFSLYFKDNRTGKAYFSGLGVPSEIKSFVME
mgnify:FL=1